MNIISSTHNTNFKILRKLYSNKTNKNEKEFVIEGSKEIDLALKSNFEIKKIFLEDLIH